MLTESVYSATYTTESLQLPISGIRRLYLKAARLDRFAMGMLRLGLVIVLVWIGGLKFASYEADGIVPLVANSPFMSFLYHYPAPEYRQHMNKEGEVVPANRQWNESNGTYRVSYGLRRHYRLSRNHDRALPHMAPGLRSGQFPPDTYGSDNTFIPCDHTRSMGASIR